MKTSNLLVLALLSIACSWLVNPGTADAGISFAAPTRIAAGVGPASLASADLTGDTKLDLVVVNRESDDAFVYVGDGFGGFTFLRSFSVGHFPLGVITSDFDGDQDADIATTAVPFNSGTVSAWLGSGDGSFQSAVVLTADDGTRSVASELIDHDGALDLVVTNPQRGNISVFLGDGDGTFGSEIRTDVGGSAAFPTDLVVADFDEDGDLDVMTSNAQSTGDSLGLVLGNGDGSFSAATQFATTCSRPESIVAADFDGDDHVDVAVACMTSSEVVVMLGDGSGGFSTPDPYELLPAGGSPYWILSGDFDNDGVADLITSNNGSFSVLRGRGDGSFDPPDSTIEIGTFLGAHAADFDGDGRLDR